MKRVQSSQGELSIMTIMCTECTVQRRRTFHVERYWSDGLRDDRESNHGTAVFFAVRHLRTFRSTECGWKF